VGGIALTAALHVHEAGLQEQTLRFAAERDAQSAAARAERTARLAAIARAMDEDLAAGISFEERAHIRAEAEAQRNAAAAGNGLAGASTRRR